MPTSTHTADAGSFHMSSLDGQLAQRCQRGETGAFSELVRRHRTRVYRIACAIVQSTDDAEDVVQEAFVRAYRAMHQYNPNSEFGAWMRRIAVNCAVSKLRQQGRASQVARQASRAGNPRPAPPPIEQVTANELEGTIRGAIAELPLKQRLAITLFGLEDMNLAETAEAIGCSVGAVKLHLHRARRKLAGTLADYLQEE